MGTAECVRHLRSERQDSNPQLENCNSLIENGLQFCPENVSVFWQCLSGTTYQIMASIDPSLVRIIEAWPQLPQQIPRDEFTDEDRPTGEWAVICGFSVETFRNRMNVQRPGRTWRIVQVNKGNYIVHLDDLPADVRGSKRIRDVKVKAAGT